MFPAVSIAAAFGASLLVCVLLIATKDQHGHLSLDSSEGVQKFHRAPTPRIGGVALLAGLVVGSIFSPAPTRELLVPMGAAALLPFAAGLWEDVTKRVPVRVRLVATMAGGILAWGLTGVSLTRVNVIGADWLLATWMPASVLFTAFAVSGASNAFNIIDGFNGLAGGVAIICIAALALIAVQVGDGEVVAVCFIVAALTMGFLSVNFPFGKLFMGDGGAYFLGFLVAWIAVLLPMRNPAVSVWATLLACGYPILETLFSIARKMRRRGHHPGEPDQVHLHMLVYRRVARHRSRGASAEIKNARTSPFIWAYALLPSAIAALWPSHTPVLVAGFAASAFVYRAIYLRLTQFRWCVTARTVNARLSMRQSTPTP